MKKMKEFLAQNRVGKRTISLILALAVFLGMFGGVQWVAVSAAEEKPYYGDKPWYDGYYHAYGDKYAPTVMSKDIEAYASSKIKEKFYGHQVSIVQDVNARRSFDNSGYYTATHEIYTGKTDMRDKWKISSFTLNFSPLTGDLLMKRSPYYSLRYKETFRGSASWTYKPHSGYETLTRDIRSKGVTVKFHLDTKVSNTQIAYSEHSAPYIQSVNVQTRENDTPLIWLVMTEELRPVENGKVNRELLSKVIRIKVKLTPYGDPDGDYETVTAYCTELVTDTANWKYDVAGNGKLGFEIDPTDWARLQASGKEWEIRSVSDACDYSTTYPIMFGYPLNSYVENRITKQYISAPLPITDSVGNGFKLGFYSGLKIKIDTLDPYVTNITFTGDSLPVSSTKGVDLDSWEDVPELDWEDLFVGTEDSFTAALEFNEQLKDLTDAQKRKVYLEWNVKGTDGKPLRTYLSVQRLTDRVNGNTKTTELVFEPLSLANLSPEETGKQIKPAKLYGANLLLDQTNNAVYDESSVELTVAPDKQLYSDLLGPVVEMGQVIKTGEGAYYVELRITDQTSEEPGRYFAGLQGGDSNVMGSVSIYSENDLSLDYVYAIFPADFDIDGDDVFESNAFKENAISGKLTGKDALRPAPLTITGEGTYILYLKMNIADNEEISDTSGAIVHFSMKDILGNESQMDCALENLQLDKKAPDANAKSTTTVTMGENNSAEFAATVTASDMNGVARIDYKWGTEGAWTQHVVENEATVTFQIPSKIVSGTGTTEDSLEIKVIDKYGNTTVLDTISFFADLSKVVPQYTYSGADQPNNTNDILITAPVSTKDGGKVDGYVRVVWEKAAGEYVIGYGPIGKDETISLFGENQLTWVSAKLQNGKYTNVEALTDSGLTELYGSAAFVIWAAKEDLAVTNNATEDPGTMTSQRTVTNVVHRTSKRDASHTVTFGKVVTSAGADVAWNGTYNGLEYYGFYADTFAGAVYDFSIANALIPEWVTLDVDWNNSYAVLLRVNDDGTIPESPQEVTARRSLSAGSYHTLTVPGLDKDNEAFTTGVYVWKVVLAQKAGGNVQEFLAPARLLLDAVEVDVEFGVYSYESKVSNLGNGPYGTVYDEILVRTQKNEDGTPLDTIYVAVAEAPDSVEVITDANGQPVYAVMPVNSGSLLDLEITLDTTQLGGKACMGEALGVLEGIRYWNANAPVDLDNLPFEETRMEGTDAIMDILEYLDWYSNNNNCIVVDDLSVLDEAKSHADFRLTKGVNRIAYQLKLTNGEMSEPKYFDLVLQTAAPEIQMQFTPDAGRMHQIQQADGTVFYQNHVQSVTASVTDYFSASEGLDFYQITYGENNTHYWYEVSEVSDPNNIILTQGGHGHEGIPEYYVGTPWNLDYLLAVDGYGNGVIIFPVIGTEEDTENTDFETVIIPGLGQIGSLTLEHQTVGERGNFMLNIGHTYTNKYHEDDDIIRVMDGYSVQIDDREPVYIDARGWEYTYDEDGYILDGKNFNEQVEEGVNDAGISSVYSYGAVSFAFPYDPEQPLGAALDHTITVRAYIAGEVTDEEVLYVNQYDQAYNLRPALYPDAELGMTTLNGRYTDKTEETLDPDNFYSGSYVYGYADIMIDEADGFVGRHQIITMSAENPVVEYMDKYGNRYTQTVPLNLPDDPKIEISTTEPTVGPVIVTITSESSELFIDTVDDYNEETEDMLGVPAGTIVEGNGTKELKLTLYNNSHDFDIENPAEDNTWFSYDGIIVYYNNEEDYLRVVVDNIYNEPVKPKVVWTYVEDEVLETYERDGVTYNNVVFGQVDAILVDENEIPLIDPMTGETPTFTFEPGGVTSVTFSGYTNIAGVAGEDITATLPVTLLHYVDEERGETPEPVADVWAPNVSITGNTSYNGKAQPVHAAYVNTTDRDSTSVIADLISDWRKDWTETYGADQVFSNSSDFLACYGWAGAYRLDVTSLDESPTKVFITKDTNADAPAYNGRSDTVDGATVLGRTITVTKNCTFYIHVVDQAGNATTIPMQVTALGGEVPAPTVVVAMSKDATFARVYLTPANIEGIENLQITTGLGAAHPNAKVETDTSSAFYGLPYLEYTENGNQTIYYSYEFNGHKITGSSSFRIDRIDTTPMMVADGYPKWSANYDPNVTPDNMMESWVRTTNQNITVQFTFNKAIGDAYLADESGNKVDLTFASVSFLAKQATVEYIQNGQPLKLVCVSATNGADIITIDLPAIMTIDKWAPVVSDASVSYAANHRSAVITLKVNELAVLSTGQYLAEADGSYVTSQTVKENGNYTFVLTDKAGNRTVKTVSVTDLITDGLTIAISTTANDSGVVDPATFAPNVGDTIYVKTNRDATITLDHMGDEISARANQWTKVTIARSVSGLYPIIRAEDAFGNAAIVQLERVPIADNNAPYVILRKSLISMSLNSTEEEIAELLKSNLLVSDDTTASDQLVYRFDYAKPSAGGKVNVTYYVTDASGNTATCTGQIRFYSDEELIVKVNGQVIEREETATVRKGDVELYVNSAGEPYKIQWKSGIKTVAQMKLNSQSVTSYTEEAKAYALDFAETGYYTVVITTQSQDNYRIIVYVED